MGNGQFETAIGRRRNDARDAAGVVGDADGEGEVIGCIGVVAIERNLQRSASVDGYIGQSGQGGGGEKEARLEILDERSLFAGDSMLTPALSGLTIGMLARAGESMAPGKLSGIAR